MRTCPLRENPIQEERPKKSPRHRAYGQRGDTDPLHQQRATYNGAQPIDQRRHRLHAELFPHQQNRAKYPTGKETQLRRQQYPRQAHAQRRLLRIESRKPPMDVPRSKYLCQHNGSAQHQVHGRQNH